MDGRSQPHEPRSQFSVHVGTLWFSAARFSVRALVARCAQCNQIAFFVTARLTPQFEMVHLQVLHATAILAAPSVALQYQSMQFAVALRVKSVTMGFGPDLLHRFFPMICDRKLSRWEVGRNW